MEARLRTAHTADEHNCRAEKRTKKQQNKKTMIFAANTIVEPRAVMIV